MRRSPTGWRAAWLFVEYRTENLQIVPVFGPAALAVSPRVGHIHVTVDDAAWHWADASGNPVIINGLAPGPHTVLIQLVNADHQPIDEGTVVGSPFNTGVSDMPTSMTTGSTITAQTQFLHAKERTH